MPDESVKRRTDRIAMAIPIRISGLNESGQSFDVEARTVMLSRHGATIVVKQGLKAEQEVKVRHSKRGIEAAFRVVGRIGGGDEGFVYGVAQLDPAANLWGIGFPAIADAKRVVGRLLMECSACQSQEVVYLNELEVQVFQANQSLARACKPCKRSTLWKGASGDQMGKGAAGSSAEASPESAPRPQSTTVGHRRHPRVNVRLLACIRQPGFADEVVTTENVSRGGFCFKGSKAYLVGSPVEVSVPYSAGGANIFVPARIAHVFERTGDNAYRVGVAYIQDVENLRQH